MNRLRNLLRRNRGLLAALGAVLVALPVTSKLWLPGPRVSWTEVIHTTKDRPAVGVGDQVAFSPDGRVVFISDSAGARLRDLKTGLVRELAPGEIGKGLRSHYARFLDGGRFMLGYLREPHPPGLNVHSFRIWEAATGREWVRIPEVGDDSAYSNRVVSADGSTFAYPPWSEQRPTGKLQSVGVWKPAWNREVRRFPGVDPIALSGDGRFLAASGQEKPMATVLVYDVVADRQVATIAVGPLNRLRSLALSHDGKLLAENQMPRTVLWDVPTATPRLMIETQTGPTLFGAGASLLYIGNRFRGDWRTEAWDLSTELPRRIFRGPIYKVSPDGRRVFKPKWSHPQDPGDDSPNPTIVNGPTHVVDFSSEGDPDRGIDIDAHDAAFSMDGELMATFDMRTEPARLAGLLGYLPGVIRPFIGAIRQVKQIRVIDTRSGRDVATVKLPEELTNFPDYDLLADNKTLAIHYVLGSGQDGPDALSIVQLWDVPAGPPSWPVAAGCAVFVLALGVRFYIRARRRALAASMPV